MLDFWKNVKDLLDYKDISQKELAAAINESYNTLQSWINRERLPNVEQAAKIARFLNVSMEYLVFGKDERTKAHHAETIKLLEKAIQNLR